MGDIEHTNLVADGVVFFDDAGVLDRHIKTGKRTHLRAELHVEVVQTSLFKFLFHKKS